VTNPMAGKQSMKTRCGRRPASHHRAVLDGVPEHVARADDGELPGRSARGRERSFTGFAGRGLLIPVA
jgi:hypothetical protein